MFPLNHRKLQHCFYFYTPTTAVNQKIKTWAMEGFQKWITRRDYLPDNPMDTPGDHKKVLANHQSWK
jgi:hypothetical protein